MLKPATSDPNYEAATKRFIEHPEEFGGFNVLQVQTRIATNPTDSAHKIERSNRDNGKRNGGKK